MAASLFQVSQGIQNKETSVSVKSGAVDLETTGLSATTGSLYQKTDGTLWIKYGGSNTNWRQILDSTGSGEEDGYQNTFMGKSAAGSENPTYSSTDVVTQSGSLESAIGELDAEVGADYGTLEDRTLGQLTASTSVSGNIALIDTLIGGDTDIASTNYISVGVEIFGMLSSLDAQLGAQPTANTRTNSAIVGSATTNANIENLDDAIGSDSDISNTNYISTGATVSANLSTLDGQVNTNANSISALQSGLQWLEKVDVLTATDLSSQSGLSVTWSDDDGGAPSLSVGDRVASTNDDTIYVAASGSWSAASALNSGETFAVGYDLTDPVNQEGGAIYNYDGSNLVELLDLDFELADSIKFNSYSAVNGNIASSDNMEVAIEKLDGNQQDIQTLTGASQGDTDLGTFTGSTIADSETVKGALQDVEDAVEGNDSDISDLEAAVGSSTGVAGMDYTSTNVVTVDTTAVAAISAIDVKIGANPTANSRTNNPIVGSNTVAANIEAIDDAIGLDSDITAVSRTAGPITTANSINANIDALDAAIGANVSNTEYLTPSATVNANLDNIADAVEELGIGQTSQDNVSSTGNIIDTVTATGSGAGAVKWFVSLHDSSNSKRAAYEIWATHNGTTAEFTEYANVNAGGTISGITWDVDFSGGNIRLKLDSTSVSVNVRVQRQILDL